MGLVVHATNTGDFVSTSSSQIRIEINVDKEVMDFDTGYLMFDISGISANTPSFIPWAASSWIKDIRVYDRAGRERHGYYKPIDFYIHSNKKNCHHYKIRTKNY